VHDPIVEPHAVIVIDPTLLHQVDVFSGLRTDGYVLINTTRSLRELGLDELIARLQPERTQTVPATQLARDLLGRPLPNAAILGGFAALSGAVSLSSVTAAVRARFAGKVGDGNAAAAERAFAFVRRRRGPDMLALTAGRREALGA
jgi:pyruvate ferredoxin oxidoreductase gamma subunit